VTTCVQPGCGGVIQDGYCDTCGLAASAPSGPSAPSRSRGRGSSRSARGRLGAGLVEIPPVPYRDPARLTPDEDRRIELIDLANAIRPRTLT